MKVTIDRMEKEYAVMELVEGIFVGIPKVLLPKLAEAGDVVTIEVDEEATKRRRERLEQLTSYLQEE